MCHNEYGYKLLKDKGCIMKYNYVVFGTEDQYYTYGYSELNKHSNTIYLEKPSFLNKAYGFKDTCRRFHLSEKVNRIIPMPNKEFWNRHLFNYCFDNEKPICFVFFSASKFADSIPFGFVDYLKSKYDGAKFVVFYQDLVKFKRKVSVETYRKKMDLLISFDYKDAEDYGMIYHSLVYSDISLLIDVVEMKDIYFCGAAKNRLNEIIDAYKYFKESGLTCDFHVIVDNPRGFSNDNGLMFHKYFSYYENLRHVKSCRFLLEIMQKGGTGYTIRACECIAFNKKMITNNAFIKKADFYDDNNFLYYDCLDNIDRSFINSNESPTSHKYLELISPYKFMEFIDNHLS